MSIIAQLRSLQNYFIPGEKCSTSQTIYQATTAALFAFCMLVSSLQYFGEPIQCVQDKKDEDAAINERVMNSFCFISGTYTVSQDGLGYECDSVGKYHAGPGVAPNPAYENSIRRQSYYIWIPYVLFFQALTFLVPNSYWTYCEGGLIDRLLAGVTEENKKKTREISAYFLRTLKTYKFFEFAWILQDILALGIVLGNFFLTDHLLGGWFKTYGSRVLSFNADVSNCWSPVDDAFPKVTKCTFHKFGAGGSLQNFDSLCVMALNVVNEKIYMILWFWFLILIPISFSCILLKIGAIVCLKCLTKKNLKALMQFSWAQLLTGVPCFMSAPILATFVEKFESSDWIFFSHLTSAMTCTTYQNFIGNVKDIIDKENGSSEGSLV